MVEVGQIQVLLDDSIQRSARHLEDNSEVIENASQLVLITASNDLNSRRV